MLLSPYHVQHHFKTFWQLLLEFMLEDKLEFFIYHFFFYPY